MWRSREIRYSKGSEKISVQLPKSTSDGRGCKFVRSYEWKLDERARCVEQKKKRETARVRTQEPLMETAKETTKEPFLNQLKGGESVNTIHPEPEIHEHFFMIQKATEHCAQPQAHFHLH